jgi:hypothetical protein
LLPMLPLAAIAALGLNVTPNMSVAQGWPQTKPERTGYKETSSYQEVVDFIQDLMARNPPMRLEWIGRSEKGKSIPLVVVAKNPQITPLQAKAEGKVVLYLQANIHAGEVEGKEAVLMLLRELTQNPKHPWLDKLVIVSTPIYNIDGNDNWGPLSRNRPSQDGPDPVGQRASGQGFDLNRDCMKAESHEFRAVLEHVYTKWDPEAIMDLHTTNGTRHGYVLTYSPPILPTTDEGVLKYSRDVLLPRIRAEFRKATGNDLFDYGNTARPYSGIRWETFGWEPRYVSNYAGVRNRVGVLSEAASFQSFQVRVDSTLRFVKLVLNHLAKDSKRVVDLCRKADARMVELSQASPPKEVGIRFAIDERGKEKVMLEKPNPQDPVARNKAPKYFEMVEMPVFDRFKTTKSAKFPAGYVFPASESDVADLLVRQGATVERLTSDWQSGGDFFEIKEAEVAGQAFQGHKLIRLEGEFRAAKAKFEKGMFLVRTGQPTGLLIFHMMEPESLDGAVAWGFFGESFKVGESLPVTKVFGTVIAPTEVYSPKSWR